MFVVLNKVRNDLVKKGKMLNVGQVENILKTKILASIEESDEILLSDNIFLPKLSKSNSQFKQLAKMVEKNLANAKNYQQIYGGLFKREDI